MVTGDNEMVQIIIVTNFSQILFNFTIVFLSFLAVFWV